MKKDPTFRCEIHTIGLKRVLVLYPDDESSLMHFAAVHSCIVIPHDGVHADSGNNDADDVAIRRDQKMLADVYTYLRENRGKSKRQICRQFKLTDNDWEFIKAFLRHYIMYLPVYGWQAKVNVYGHLPRVRSSHEEIVNDVLPCPWPPPPWVLRAINAIRQRKECRREA